MKIDINYTVSGGGKKKPTSAFDCAQLAKSICDELLGVPEIWAVEENLGNDFYNLRRNSRRKRNVPCDVFGSYKWVSIGDAAFVVYEDMRKSRPKIIGFSGRLEHSENEIPVLGLWITPEADAKLSCKSSSSQPQPIFASGAMNTLHTLDRTLDSSSFTYTENATDILGLLLFYIGPTAAPTDVILASLSAVWDDGSDSTLTGESLKITEHALSGTASPESPIEISSSVLRVTNPSTYSPYNRHKGYFFIHQVSETEVIYTICLDAGIYSINRNAIGTIISSSFSSDSLRPLFGRSGNTSCVEDFLCECGYAKLQDDGSNIVSGGCLIQCYKRNPALNWVSLAPTNIATIAAGAGISISGELTTSKRILSVGLLDSDNWDKALLSSRWPFLRHNNRSEWWAYANVTGNPNPHFLTIAIDANTGSGRIIDNFIPDLSWKFLYGGLVAQESDRLQADSDASIVGAGTLIADPSSPKEFTTLTYTVPADDLADPPIPAHEEEYVQYINGFRNGWYYTGNSFQSACVNINGANIEEDRFYAAPLISDSGGYIVEGGLSSGATSCQVPSGVIGDDKKHFGCCFEPQHYVNGLVAVDNVPVYGADQHYENGSRWHKFGDVGYSELGTQYYIWWLNVDVVFNAGTGLYERISTEGAFFITTDDTNDPRGTWNGPDGTGPTEQIGNTNLGAYNPVAVRHYSLKQHGEYDYTIRWKPVLSVCGVNDLLYRCDISEYLVDGELDGYASRSATPQRKNVWQWLPVKTTVGSYLFVLREKFYDITPDGNGVQTSGRTDPFLELYSVGSASMSLISSVNLHKSDDLVSGSYSLSQIRLPKMTVGTNASGVPYALVITEWENGGSVYKMASSCILSGGALVVSEYWNSGSLPSVLEAENLVHYDEKFFWISGGVNVVERANGL